MQKEVLSLRDGCRAIRGSKSIRAEAWASCPNPPLPLICPAPMHTLEILAAGGRQPQSRGNTFFSGSFCIFQNFITKSSEQSTELIVWPSESLARLQTLVMGKGISYGTHNLACMVRVYCLLTATNTNPHVVTITHSTAPQCMLLQKSPPLPCNSWLPPWAPR